MFTAQHQQLCERLVDCLGFVAFVLFFGVPLSYVLTIVESSQVAKRYNEQCSGITEHPIVVRDLGHGNHYQEVNRSWCGTTTVAAKRNPFAQVIDTLTKDHRKYQSNAHHPTVYMRCSNSSLMASVGALYITGSGNVFCGPIEFDLVVTGSNNTIYRVVHCLFIVFNHLVFTATGDEHPLIFALLLHRLPQFLVILE